MAPKLPRAHRVRQEGSKYRVLGVPIFAEHTRCFSDPKTGKNHVVKVDRARLEKFASNGNKRAREDAYLAAIHPVHNGEQGANKSACGLLDNYRVETFQFEGKPQAVLVVDLIARDQGELETIKRHPYRSPETNLEKNEIGTLALLERQAPFFKFPLFKTYDDAGAVYRAESVNEPETAGVAFAAYRGETHYAPLYRWSLDYQEDSMKNADKPKGKEHSCDSKKDPVKKDGSKKDDAGEMAGYAKRMDSMEGYMKRMNKFMDALEAEDDEEEQAKRKGDEPAALLSQEQLEHYADQEDLLVATAKRVDELTNALYKMQGTIDGLKAENTSLKGRNEATDLVNWAMAETDGLVRPANFTDRVSAIYRDSGSDAARCYVDGLVSGAPEREDYQDRGGEGEGLSGEALPECVEKYRSDPIKLERAKAAYSEYQSMGASTARGFGTVAEYVDLEFSSSRN